MYNRIYTTRTLDITTKWQHVKLNVGRILYVIMQKQDAEIHLYGGKIYTTRITCGELKEQLGEDFLEIRRGDRKSTRLNSSHRHTSRMPSSA